MAITTNGGAGITADAVATLSNKTLEAPVINNATFTGQQAGLQIAFNDAIVFEGTTADANELTLSAGEPTADRVVTLPNATTTLVGTNTTDTFSNKSISLTSNTVTGTIAEFNTALSDADFATLAGSETLSNKTLTAPKFATGGEIDDANGNEIIKFPSTVASAVNEITVSNAATAGSPSITATGDDTNINLNLVAKGSGTVQAGGVDVVTTSGTQTLTNKTLTTPVLSLNTSSNTATGRISYNSTSKSVQIGDGTNTLDYPTSNVQTNAQSGTTYTLALTDKDKLVEVSNTSAITITVPLNSSVAFPTGTQINILQTNTGQITIAGAGGVTVNANPGLKLRAQWAFATLIKRSTDGWVLVGDITA